MNITKNHGLEFLDFISISEEEMYTYQPLAGSFAVIKCNGKYLMCYNVWREQWEIPAGRREGDETPKECAIRELYEETGQVVSDLEFKGLLMSKEASSEKVKFNPVYFKEVENLQPFLENEETSEIKLWDLKEELGYVDSVDIRIFEFI
ncbi:Putative 8-oxo-dGTP diphosphatase YtkD [Bacillus sp. THAF10]|uniref:NUDIX domain-containing protein n=1 Tax=Bacillus sp. THAF10 TaxID=2587848 RepID=UPI00126976F9|nr:NUDIX hydrolase [Bacillus sp. THAF10]QFT89661.1 Putative 8-oxo-dGTP diphosphatase YtkD [Bacillus sp. THAF10]